MRVFVAIELPDRIKKKLKDIQKEFHNLGKITFVNDFHLTLKFLGEISPLMIERIKERLGKIEFKEFELHLSKLGVFPDREYITILWMGLKPTKNLKKLQHGIESKLLDLFSIDRNFKGHITIGRVKSINDRISFLEKLETINIEGSFTVKNFYLIKSDLTSEGPKYEVIGKY